MTSVDALVKCGDIQRSIFYGSFLTHRQVGEMICVNDEETGDSYLFEHWQIHEVDFVACFHLLSEDSLITHGLSYQYVSFQRLVDEKNERQRFIYRQFLDKIKAEGKDLAELKRKAVEQGKDPTLLDFKEFTRDLLEDKLPAGKKTIQGDRASTIEVLERQKEIPNDLQRPRLNQYFLEPSDSLREFILATKDKSEEFRERCLIPVPKALNLNTTLPFLWQIIPIVPIIYEFPAKEADLSNL